VIPELLDLRETLVEERDSDLATLDRAVDSSTRRSNN